MHRFEQLWRDGDRAAFAIECSSGTYVRSLIADLGDAYCEELRRTAIGPFRVEDADPARIVPLAEALSLPATVDRARGRGRARAPATAWRSRASAAGGHVLLVDDDGPIAVAEPRADGLLKPVVGFRG